MLRRRVWVCVGDVHRNRNHPLYVASCCCAQKGAGVLQAAGCCGANYKIDQIKMILDQIEDKDSSNMDMAETETER